MCTMTLIDGSKVDSYSEAWRHECEARTALNMPLLERRAHLSRVESKRGMEQRRRLESTMHAIWLGRQVDQLLAMPRDDERMAHLLRIENATNSRMRGDVEKALNGRLAANDNERNV